MEAICDILYGEPNGTCLDGKKSTETFAFDNPFSTAYKDRQGLATALQPHLEKCVDALILKKNRDAVIGQLDHFLDVFLERQVRLSQLKDGNKNEEFIVSGIIDETRRHLGSVPHLLFGRITGDALDLHMLYGALLSPTGGIVGADNSFACLRYFEFAPATGRHALAHDAFGYLINHHSIGPGQSPSKTRQNSFYLYMNKNQRHENKLLIRP